MAGRDSQDPRARRTRAALKSAFKDLLQQRPIRKIKITDITSRAGVARHTFYNHYETKADLRDDLIDSVLEDFFATLEGWDFYGADAAGERAMLSSFFRAWKDNAEILELLKTADIEVIITDRLNFFFTRLFYRRIQQEIPGVDLALARYVISYNAYSLLGLLKPWFESGFRHHPDHLAGLMVELTGSRRRMAAVQKYSGVITD